MGRIIAFLLGGFSLALYAPKLFMSSTQLATYRDWWIKTLTAEWYEKIFEVGPGVFAGCALVLLAVRGRDTDSH